MTPGVPRLMMLPSPFEIVQRPDYVSIVFQWNGRYRGIDMSGKPLEVPFPVFSGFSAGHWDGDVLDVETRGVLGTTLLDAAGMPHSEDLVITERLRLIDNGRKLEDRMRFEDPATFTAPWETVVTYRKLQNTEIQEDICVDRLEAGGPAIEVSKD